jgi:hypothetical protein
MGFRRIRGFPFILWRDVGKSDIRVSEKKNSSKPKHDVK